YVSGTSLCGYIHRRTTAKSATTLMHTAQATVWEGRLGGLNDAADIMRFPRAWRFGDTDTGPGGAGATRAAGVRPCLTRAGRRARGCRRASATVARPRHASG